VDEVHREAQDAIRNGEIVRTSEEAEAGFDARKR
jgi:hypothetical protein